MAAGIKERLMELKFHVVALALFVIASFSLLRLGPSLSAVLAFFWPLLLSTAFFLATVVVLLRISPPPTDATADRAGEELMDYVAGQPQDEATADHEPEEEGVEKNRGVWPEPEADHRKSE